MKRDTPPSRTTRRALLGAVAVATGAGLVANAHGQNVFEQLMRVLRDRIPAVFGGFEPEMLAAPEYVAAVLQQIVARNRDETLDPTWMGTSDALRARIGTVTVVIEIASNGALIDVRPACATGQGRAFSGKAVDAVRRAAPFPRPIPLNRESRAGSVKIDETFLIQDSGRWNLESVLEASRARSADRP
ncbi:MAG: energy transducer TonB [Burkholderiaceae bacterium]|nr:energy transducer TonB [Burkholderiaceae bacterium]